VSKLNLFLKHKYDTLLKISKKITSERYPDYEDLLHDVIVELYKKKTKLINKLIDKNEITFYIVRIMINQYHSNTSPYYNKYKKHQYYKDINNIKELYIYSKDNNIEEKNNRLKWIEDKLKDLRWFDVQVFKIYYKENYSLNTMSKATKINRSTLGKSIRFIKNYLKNEREK
jgi:DNA-directed RNA polymerase specialized sigma24 family protein